MENFWDCRLTKMNKYYYLGPWQLKIDKYLGGYYDAPDNTIGRVDLRSNIDNESYGFFSSSEYINDSNYIYLGDSLYNKLSNIQLSAWLSCLNLDKVNGLTLLDILWDTLTINADPDGVDRCYPIMPTSYGIVELHLGGHSLIKSHKFTGINDPMWTNIQASIRRDYKGISNIYKKYSGKHSDLLMAKLLGSWKLKYNISDEKLFIPDDMEKIKAIDPTTTVSDDFNRSDGNIGSDWADESGTGDWVIVSNKARASNTSAVNVTKHATSMSSSDNYSGAYIVDNTGDFAGRPGTSICCRQTTDQNFYFMLFNNVSDATDGIRLFKCVSGSNTQLDQGASGPSGYNFYVEADGSSIKGTASYLSLELTATDTSISSGVGVGLRMTDTRGFVDDFYGGDLVAPPTTANPTTIITTQAPTTTVTTLPPTTLLPTTPMPTIPPTTLQPTTIGPTTAYIPPEVLRRGKRNFGFSLRDNWR